MEANLYRFYTTVCSGLKCEYEPTIFYFPRKSRIQAKTYKGKIDPTNYLDIRAYVPDFRITCGKHVWYIEAKGVMDRQALEKARLLKRHYQWVRLYFVTINNYNLIKKHYSKRIRNWE